MYKYAKKKTLSCLQDNVFLIVFQWPPFEVGICHTFAIIVWQMLTVLAENAIKVAERCGKTHSLPQFGERSVIFSQVFARTVLLRASFRLSSAGKRILCLNLVTVRLCSAKFLPERYCCRPVVQLIGIVGGPVVQLIGIVGGPVVQLIGIVAG